MKVSCVLHYRGIQLILACNWARLAVLVAGKGRGECFYFFCFSSFIPVPLYRWHKMTHKGWHVIKPQHSQSTGNKILWKREIINFSSLPQYFQYISNFRSQSTHSFVKCVRFVLLNSGNLICQGTDISKYLRESLGLRGTESRLYFENCHVKSVNYKW